MQCVNAVICQKQIRATDRTELEVNNGPDQVSHTKRRPNKKISTISFYVILFSVCLVDSVVLSFFVVIIFHDSFSPII
jgi:hypothetical protein